MMAPKPAPTLIPTTCKRVPIHGKGDMADLSKDLEEGMILLHVGGPNVITGP